MPLRRRLTFMGGAPRPGFGSIASRPHRPSRTVIVGNNVFAMFGEPTGNPGAGANLFSINSHNLNSDQISEDDFPHRRPRGLRNISFNGVDHSEPPAIPLEPISISRLPFHAPLQVRTRQNRPTRLINLRNHLRGLMSSGGLIDIDKLLMGPFITESLYRALLRILTLTAVVVTLTIHLVSLKSTYKTWSRVKPRYEESGQNSVHIPFLQLCCLYRVIEHCLSIIDYVYICLKKKSTYWENYIHTGLQIGLYSACMYFLGTKILLIWVLLLVDFLVRFVLFIVLFWRFRGNPRSMINLNPFMFIPQSATLIMAALKVQGVIGYWMLAFTPYYIFNILLIAFCVVFILKLRKCRNRDCIGKPTIF